MDTTSLSQLPPPPQGQTGVTLDSLQSLPPPPSGQKGMTLDQINQTSTSAPQQSLSDKVWGAVSTAGKMASSIPGPIGGVTNMVKVAANAPGQIRDAFTAGVGQIKEGYSDTKFGNSPAQALEGGLKVAAGTVNAVSAPLAPVFAPISEGVNYLADKLSNLEGVQKFAQTNAGKNTARIAQDVGNLSTIAGAAAGLDKAPAVAEKIKTNAPDIMTKSVEQLRSEKIAQGFEEQNTRLKTADKAFNKNTKTYTTPEGVKTTVTPIDTFKKYNIAPTVEKGSIQMGDYNQGTGALGKIKEQVGNIDAEIDSKLIDNGKGVTVDHFKNQAIEAIKKDDTLRQSGKIASTLSKLENVFEDYKQSYGEILNETEINAIRKVMNLDFHPDTVDVSRVIGDAARKIVYEVTPDKEVQMLLRKQGELLSARKYAEVVNGTKVAGGKLGNIALRTAGVVVGSTLHQLPVIGPLIGLMGGEYTARALQQTQFKSIGAETKALFSKPRSTGGIK